MQAQRRWRVGAGWRRSAGGPGWTAGRFPQTLRRPDVVFGPARVAVFVDGCSWHSCQEHLHPPKANRAWWEQKPASIRARDADVAVEFAERGWCVVRAWEHEDPDAAADRVAALVRARRPPPAG